MKILSHFSSISLRLPLNIVRQYWVMRQQADSVTSSCDSYGEADMAKNRSHPGASFLTKALTQMKHPSPFTAARVIWLGLHA